MRCVLSVLQFISRQVFLGVKSHGKNLSGGGTLLGDHNQSLNGISFFAIQLNGRHEMNIATLHNCIKQNEVQGVLSLLKSNADIHRRDRDRNTPLHIAVEMGNEKIVRILMEHGANIHYRNKFWNTPLMLAMDSGNSKLITIMVGNENAAVKVACYNAIYTAENIRRRRLARTWQSINRHGLFCAVDRIVSREQTAEGFNILLNADKAHLSFEATVIKYPEQFSERALTQAKNRIRLSK